jgi:hypothetical protein
VKNQEIYFLKLEKLSVTIIREIVGRKIRGILSER